MRIVILGGGTAGWLTAAYLSRTLARPGTTTTITVVESAEVPIIGVGEGSFPTLRETMATLGVGEGAFVRAADATFKQGVRFTGWAGRPTPGGGGADDYLHVFDLPYGGDALLPAWLATGDDRDRPAYADAVSAQGVLMRGDRAPKRPGDPDWAAPFNYAYHFDAPKLAAFLRDVAIANGVERIEATIGTVVRDGDTHIAAIVPDDGRDPIAGDLFVDCSGFAAKLIGETLGAPFREIGDVLFNDRALAVQIPYDRPDAPIASHTHATAHPGGWFWDIGLSARRGIGCVYSSAHMRDEDAADTLAAYTGHADLSPRQIRFRTGYRSRQWIGNCIAVGLAAGFFEPLESTGIMLIEVAARMIAELAVDTDRDAMAAAAALYDRSMTARFAAIVEFLKLHYAVTARTDTAYWRDNADPATWPEALREKIAMWRRRPPSRFDFVVDHETFLPPSWAYILYGMGFGTVPPALDPRALAATRPVFDKVRAARAQAPAVLPTHRALVSHYHRI